MTPATKQLSKQAESYMCQLLGEWITGEQVENYQSEFMTRGQDLEDQAIRAFEFLTDLETSPGGFVTTEDGMIGASPDRLIGDESDLEIKCPLIQTAVSYALKGLTEEHVCQVQGRMMVEERDSVYVFAYHPRISIPPLKVNRDEKFIVPLRGILNRFVETMLKCREELEKRFGPFPRTPPQALDPDDPGPLGITLEEENELVGQILAEQRKRNAL